MRVTQVEASEKTPEGVLEHNIFLVEKESLRVEIASIMTLESNGSLETLKKR
jgi:hypothetical protein